MKTNKLYTRLVALILSVASILALAACQSTIETKPDETVPGVVETAPVETPEVTEAPVETAPVETSTEATEETATEPAVPDIVNVPDPDLNPLFYGKPTTPEDELKKYGEIETLVKALVKAPEATTDPAKVNKTSYGTVNWNTASQGYITFTATGASRILYLQGPNGIQATAEAKNGETIKIALVDGTGKYQYGIGTRTQGKNYLVSYKNSFTVDAMDTDLGPYLVSTAWGDYANAPKATAKAAELWNKDKTQLENVKAIAEWVAHTMNYDKKLKQGSSSFYVNPDSVIENGGGVCNEFSKLLSAMLRSQGVPAYYQVGQDTEDASKTHAWVRAWVELENYEKDGKVYSKGAWVTIEATSGSLDKTSGRDIHTITPETNYAN